MFAYCRGQSVVVHGGFTGSCGMCTPLQSKSIQNSRVLGYGQLNGHVASIVSMFSKEKVLKRDLHLQNAGKRKLYLRGMDDGKLEVGFTISFAKKIILSFKQVLQRKISFPQVNLCQNLADT